MIVFNMSSIEDLGTKDTNWKPFNQLWEWEHIKEDKSVGNKLILLYCENKPEEKEYIIQGDDGYMYYLVYESINGDIFYSLYKSSNKISVDDVFNALLSVAMSIDNCTKKIQTINYIKLFLEK